MSNLDNCICTGKSLPKLLRPAILAVLTQGPKHGYAITEELRDTPVFAARPPDHTGVYRMLQAMESEDLLVSSWEHEKTGPAKRQYRLTGKARQCLTRWKRTLQQYRGAIDGLLGLLEEAKQGQQL